MTPHKMPAKAGLIEAQSLLATLSTQETSSSELAFDASMVEEVSTAYALVLTSLLRTRDPAAPKVRLVAPSPSFVDAFSDLGLFQDLMKMEFGQ